MAQTAKSEQKREGKTENWNDEAWTLFEVAIEMESIEWEKNKKKHQQQQIKGNDWCVHNIKFDATNKGELST